MRRVPCPVTGCALGEHRPGHPHLDTPSPTALKDAGMAAAADAPRVQPWRECAEQALARLAAQRQPFTADDLIAAVGLPDTGVNRNNAVGAVVNAAARRHLIRKTGAYVPSARTLGHSRVIAVWTGA